MRRLFRFAVPFLFLLAGLSLLGGVGASAMPEAWRERLSAWVEPYAPGLTAWLAGLFPSEVPPPPVRPPEERLPFEQRLAAAGLDKGAPAFIRIIKQTSELELFLEGPKAGPCSRPIRSAAGPGRSVQS